MVNILKFENYQIIGFGFSCVEHLDGVSSARNCEDRSLEEIFRKLDGIQSC